METLILLKNTERNNIEAKIEKIKNQLKNQGLQNVENNEIESF